MGLILRSWKNKCLYSACSELGRSSTLQVAAFQSWVPWSAPWVPSNKRCYIKTRYFISFPHKLPVKQPVHSRGTKCFRNSTGKSSQPPPRPCHQQGKHTREAASPWAAQSTGSFPVELKQCKPKAAPWHGADSPAQGAWDAAQGDGSLLRLLSITEAVQESSW